VEVGLMRLKGLLRSVTSKINANTGGRDLATVSLNIIFAIGVFYFFQQKYDAIEALLKSYSVSHHISNILCNLAVLIIYLQRNNQIFIGVARKSIQAAAEAKLREISIKVGINCFLIGTFLPLGLLMAEIYRAITLQRVADVKGYLAIAKLLLADKAFSYLFLILISTSVLLLPTRWTILVTLTFLLIIIYSKIGSALTVLIKKWIFPIECNIKNVLILSVLGQSVYLFAYFLPYAPSVISAIPDHELKFLSIATVFSILPIGWLNVGGKELFLVSIAEMTKETRSFGAEMIFVFPIYQSVSITILALLYYCKKIFGAAK
jgi:hypothetical protein